MVVVCGLWGGPWKAFGSSLIRVSWVTLLVLKRDWGSDLVHSGRTKSLMCNLWLNYLEEGVCIPIAIHPTVPTSIYCSSKFVHVGTPLIFHSLNGLY